MIFSSFEFVVLCSAKNITPRDRIKQCPHRYNIQCLPCYPVFFSLNNSAVLLKPNTTCSAFRPRSLLPNVKSVCHTRLSHPSLASQYRCAVNCHKPACLIRNAVTDRMKRSVFLDSLAQWQGAHRHVRLSPCIGAASTGQISLKLILETVMKICR